MVLEKARGRYVSLDVLKTIAAFMVCYQHACGTGILSGYILAAARIAVPLFVMITGFFYEDTRSNGHEKKQLIKFLKIAVEMFAMYFLVDIAFNVVSGNLKGYLFRYVDLSLWLKFVVFNTPLTAGHSWYMWAMIYVLLFFFWLPSINRNKLFRIVFITLPLILVPLFSKYSLFFCQNQIPADLYRNSIVPVIAYFLIGIVIRENSDKIISLPFRSRLAIAVVALVGLIIERTVLLEIQGSDYKSGSYFMTAFLAIAFFIVFLDLGRVQKGNLLAEFGKKYSLNFYIIHQVFVKIETKIFDVNTVWQYAGVLFVATAGIIAVIIWDCVKNKMFNKVRL